MIFHRRRNQGSRGGARAPPIFYPRDFINIHACSADCCDHGVYYVRPPQNGIASYTYAYYITVCIAQAILSMRLYIVHNLIDITECVKLMLFSLNINIKLLDSFQSDFLLLHQDAHWVAHELVCDLYSSVCISMEK